MIGGLALDLEDISRLIEVLSRRKVTLNVGTLVRPPAPMFGLFDYVVRLRPRPSAARPDELVSFLVEHQPSAASS